MKSDRKLDGSYRVHELYFRFKHLKDSMNSDRKLDGSYRVHELYFRFKHLEGLYEL